MFKKCNFKTYLSLTFDYETQKSNVRTVCKVSLIPSNLEKNMSENLFALTNRKTVTKNFYAHF